MLEQHRGNKIGHRYNAQAWTRMNASFKNKSELLCDKQIFSIKINIGIKLSISKRSILELDERVLILQIFSIIMALLGIKFSKQW